MAKYYGVENIHTSLEECMVELKAWMERPRKEKRESSPYIHFTDIMKKTTKDDAIHTKEKSLP